MNKKLATQAILFSGSVYAAQLINVVCMTLLMHTLSVTLFGIFAYGKTLSQYFDYSHLGARYTINRYVPVSTPHKNRALLHSALFISMFVSIFILFILCIVRVIDNLPVFLLCTGGIFYSIVNVYAVYRRDMADIAYLIKVNFLICILPPLLIMIALGFGIASLTLLVFLFVIAQVLIFLIVFMRNDLFPYIFLIPKKFLLRIGPILMVGFPVLISNLILVLGMTIDRIFIKQYLGYSSVGIYSAILYVFTFLLILPGSLNQVFQPKIIIELRKGLSSLIVYKTMLYTVLLLIPVVAAVYFMTPFLVKMFMHQYLAYAYLMSIASFIIVPFALCTAYTGAFTAIDERIYLLSANIISLIIYVLFLFLYLHNRVEINFEYLLILKATYASINFALYAIMFEICFKKYKKGLEKY
jgi:O-antigen/teichoic acid export membrane protein